MSLLKTEFHLGMFKTRCLLSSPPSCSPTALPPMAASFTSGPALAAPSTAKDKTHMGIFKAKTHMGIFKAETHVGIFKAELHLGMYKAKIARGDISRANKPFVICEALFCLYM